jgi:hypothetical protein
MRDGAEERVGGRSACRSEPAWRVMLVQVELLIQG